jgi:starch-binding outer membrane protein, SusD/RagB family
MKKIICFALSGLLILVSCSDFLDADNKQNVASDDYFNTSAGFETLVNFAYAQMKPLYDGDPAIFCSGTDLYQRGRNAMTEPGLNNYKDLTPENTTVYNFYVNCYKGIQAANCVLYYAETTDARAETKAIRIAEARFLRSFFYFELVQQFGGVALVKDYVKTIMTNVPRDSVAAVYDYIISEWKDLVGAGSPLPTIDRTGRVSKQCVFHYLAKAYLTAGWDLGKNNYYSFSANYADSAISCGSGLNETFENLWWPAKDGTHQEVIFAIQYDRASSTAAGLSETANANSLQSYFGSYYNGTEAKYKYASSNYLPSLRFVRLFEPGDSRYEGTFMTKLYCTDKLSPKTTGDYYAPYKGTAATDFIAFYYPPHYARSVADIAVWRAADATHRASTIVIPLDSSSFKGNGTTVCSYYIAATSDVFGMTCIRKFDDPSSTYGTTTCYRDIVLARLAETYLIAAEANLKAGIQGKADDMLNIVRERAFRGSSIAYTKTNITIDDILTERALEFAGEKLRWKDLRRTQKLVDYNVAYNVEVTNASALVGPDGNQRLYRPIPQKAIDLNTAEITQNPGYVLPE